MVEQDDSLINKFRPEFLECTKCGRNFEKHRYFFDDYRTRVCRYCQQGLAPDLARDYYLSTDTDIAHKIKKQEEKEAPAPIINAILESALENKRRRKDDKAPIIDDCLVKAEDVNAKVTYSRLKSRKKK